MNPTPLEQRPRRRSDLVAPVLVGAGAVGTAVLLHLRDPHDAGSYGTCPFLALTGVPCPGCGSLRAVNNLTRGDLVGAVSSNLLAVALVAGLVVAWVVWTVRVGTGRSATLPTPTAWWGWAGLALVVAFGVLRVLPAGAWLAP